MVFHISWRARAIARVCSVYSEKAHFISVWMNGRHGQTFARVQCSTDQTQCNIFRTTSFSKWEKWLYGPRVAVANDKLYVHRSRHCNTTHKETINVQRWTSQRNSKTVFSLSLSPILSPYFYILFHECFWKSKTLVIKNMYYILQTCELSASLPFLVNALPAENVFRR